jgi:threonine aldolase
MRDAMANAVVGDEVYGDDPTTNKLHKDMAEILGKEAALITTSGTQANLISMMLMNDKIGSAVIIGSNSHIMYYERGGMASIGGVFGYILPNLPDGTIDMDALKYHVPSPDNPHKVKITGISLESSQNNCGGRAIQPAYISEVKKYAKKNKVKLHLDGARAWNSALYHGLSMKEYVKDFDILNVCMSKGMGCPALSVIAGT